MNKTMLALATVATISLTTAAFAEAAPSKKDVHPAPTQASVIHKQKVSHRVGGKNVVVAYHHSVYRLAARATHYSHYTGKNHRTMHVVAKKTIRPKTSS